MKGSKSLEQLLQFRGRSVSFMRRSLQGVGGGQEQFLGPLGYLFLGGTLAFGAVFFVWRDVASKTLTVPPLVGMVLEYGRGSHVGWSPVWVLGVALVLHWLGDVVIKQVGVLESMPLFLLGHVCYCLAYVKGCDLSWPHVARVLSSLRVLLMAALLLYALCMSAILMPSFPPPVRPVLAAYVVFISLMFLLSLFSRSRLLVAGSALYLLSDSFIALATFVFPGHSLFAALDLYGAWPLYVAGQICITLGCLSSFSQLRLKSHPTKTPLEASLTNLLYAAAAIASFISARRLWSP